MTSPTQTQKLIRQALLDSPYAMTRTALAQATGLSYNTIKNHVDSIEGVRAHPGNRYSAGAGTIKSGVKLKWRSHFTTTSGRHIEVDELELPSPVEAYERLMPRIPLALPDRLDPTQDPRELAQAIGDYAIFLTTIAARLEDEQDNPEWFATLGGSDGVFTPPIKLNNPYAQGGDDVPVQRVR